MKVDCECEKIKLVFEINYDNEINKFNQIGIIGLEFFGEEISENKIKIMKLQEEINKLENIKKKAVEDENYDLAKETNNQILQKKDLIQKLKEGKDIDLDLDNIDNLNTIKDKEENKEPEKNNDIETIDNNNNKNKNEKKEITSLEDGTVKRFVNRKKNVEKVSTGVSTNEKDMNIRYNKQSNPIDVDKQKVGNTLTFSQMVEKELSSNSQFSPYNNSPSDNIITKKNSNKKDIAIISEEDRDFINIINQFLPEDLLILLVSKNVKEIEKAIGTIYDDLILYNDDKDYNIFTEGISINDMVFTCSNVCLYILKKNYIPPKIMIIDVMNIFLNNKYIEIIQVVKEFGECLISLLDYLGDSNQKLREKTEKIIFEYTKKTKSQNKIINLIINTPIKKNLIKSRNHLNGRYLMVAKIVYLGGYLKNNFENILKYAINGYALNKINVRDAALDIIITLYKYEGEKVHQYFQDSGLRPAQIKTIQDKLDEIDVNSNKNKNEINNNNSNSNSENACEFCGYYKPHITKDELNIHQYKDCPMLMQCDNCKQIIEISNLNNHLLNECDFKEKYIKCNKCKQVVEKDSINEHQISENCFDVNEDKEKFD